MFNKNSLQIAVLVISLLTQFSCYGTNDFENFQNEAVKFAQNDNKIDENEYNSIVKLILSSKDEGLNNFKSLNPEPEIDYQKTVQYLLKLFELKGLKLTKEDIYNPKATILSPFNVNVFIENSASMDGYVKGVTEFETAIYNLIGDFKINDMTKTLNLNYINNEITFTKQDAFPPDIEDFIEKLEPDTFKQRGGNRSVSDIKNILATVLEKTDKDNLGILISDFVFSPGKDKDALEYLNNQSVGIKLDFDRKLKNFDLAAIVMQMQSEFNGTYYDKNNTPIPLSGNRPYYIWILGSTSQINSILEKKLLDNIKGGGYQKRIIFTSLKEPVPAEYKILLSNKIGDFQIPDGAKGPITDAETSQDEEKKGIFRFEVAVNFSKFSQDADFFSDPGNYQISNKKYTLTVQPINENEIDQTTKGFTHKLKLETKELRDDETLEIKVVGKIPSWIEATSSNDDSNIATDKNEINKTFGLKQLIEGVNGAFYPQTKENVIGILNISIKK